MELDKVLSIPIKNDPDSTQEEVKNNNASNQSHLLIENNLFHVELTVKREPDLDEVLFAKDDFCHSELILKDDYNLQQQLNIKSDPDSYGEKPILKTEDEENIGYNSTQEKISCRDNIDNQITVIKYVSEQELPVLKKHITVNASLIKNTDFKIKTVRDLRILACKNYKQCNAETLEKVNNNAESLFLQNSSYNRKDKAELICDLCGKGLRTKISLVKHVQKHTTKCKVCRKVFYTSQNHKCKPKLPQKKHKCEHCKKIFKRVDNLRNHIRKHTGEKPFICQLCDKDFKEYSSLKKHVRIHTGEKPYQCNHCKKGFTRSDHLRSHSLTHSGVKPYKCDICDRSFSQSGTLRDHKRTHTGEKPFKCQICEKAFRKAANMKNHVRNLHVH